MYDILTIINGIFIGVIVMIRRNGTNKITKVLRILALGMVITASGLISESPAQAATTGKYWYSDQGTYTNEMHAYTYTSTSGDLITTDDLNLAQKYALNKIQTKSGTIQITEEDRQEAATREKEQQRLEQLKPENQPISQEEFTEIANEKMLKLINAHRVDNGLCELKRDTILEKMATEKSQHMVAHNYMNHYYKGVLTKNVQNREYNVYTLGENCLANGEYKLTSKDANAMASSMFYQWKCSPGHNANMLDENATRIGFGFAFGNDNTEYPSYGTQIFSGDKYMHEKFYVDYARTKTDYDTLADLDNM